MKLFLILTIVCVLSACNRKNLQHTDYPDQGLKIVNEISRAEIANKHELSCQNLILVKEDKNPVGPQDFQPLRPNQTFRIQGQSNCINANTFQRKGFDIHNKRYISIANLMIPISRETPSKLSCAFVFELINADMSSKKYFLRTVISTDACKPHMHSDRNLGSH